MTSISALTEKAIASKISEPPNMARSTMRFLPNLSANVPQIGEEIAIVMACPLNTAPDRKTKLIPRLEPKLCT
jgi:hypothetical protein